jgi:hypothetical protein
VRLLKIQALRSDRARGSEERSIPALAGNGRGCGQCVLNRAGVALRGAGQSESRIVGAVRTCARGRAGLQVLRAEFRCPLTEHATLIKAAAIVVNVAAVGYLVYKGRLFGVRGGHPAYLAEVRDSTLLAEELQALGRSGTALTSHTLA